MNLEQRLRGRIVVSPSGCWEFGGNRDRHGYGLIREGPVGNVRHAEVYRDDVLAILVAKEPSE